MAKRKKIKPIQEFRLCCYLHTKSAAVACLLPQLTNACDLGGKFVALAPITLTAQRKKKCSN